MFTESGRSSPLSPSMRASLIPNRHLCEPVEQDSLVASQLTKLLSIGSKEDLLSAETEGVQYKTQPSVFFHAQIALITAASVAFYFWTAQGASDRYLVGADERVKAVFPWLLVVSALVTNAMFNYMSLYDLLKEDADPLLTFCNFSRSLFKEGGRIKVISLVASGLTVAPFFFLGFAGDVVQKSLVAIAAILSLPVFYSGSLNVYQYSHIYLIQYPRWIIRCAPEKSDVVDKKYRILIRLKETYKWFCLATNEERATFLGQLDHGGALEQINALLGTHQLTDENEVACVNQSYALLKNFFLAIFGFFVIAQNFGHVASVYSGIVAFQKPCTPLFISIPISFGAAIAGIGNLLPGLGFSFSGILGFNVIELGRKMIPCVDVPRVQHNLMERNSSVLWTVGLLILRVLYCFSGFSNDQLNYEAGKSVGFSETLSFVLGCGSGVAGALVFNGVPCENLMLELMGVITLSLENQSDDIIQAVKFEAEFKKLLEVWESASTSDVHKVFSSGNFNAFFSSQSSEDVEQNSSHQPLLT